jgi:DNA repair protein RecO (recombination protein O)
VTRLSRTPAIVLRAIDYSETSQVLHLFTREHGKLHCIAKGSKRAKSAFHGAFDLLGVYDVIRLEKQPGSLDLLTQAEAVKEYRAVRADLGRFGAACWMAEFVDEMTGEAIPQPELYDLLKGSLERLDKNAPVAETVFLFFGRALAMLGYEPRMDECGMCKSRLSGPEAYFSARDGGVVCTRCKPLDSTRLLFKRPVFDAVAAFCAGRAFNLTVMPTFAADVLRAFDYHLRHLMQGRELKSARAMREAVLRRASATS